MLQDESVNSLPTKREKHRGASSNDRGVRLRPQLKITGGDIVGGKQPHRERQKKKKKQSQAP